VGAEETIVKFQQLMGRFLSQNVAATVDNGGMSAEGTITYRWGGVRETFDWRATKRP